MPTFQEVKDFIRDHAVYPNQLFTIEDLKNDRVFGVTIAAGETAAKKVTELETEVDNVKKQSADSVRATEVAAAKGRFEKLIPEGATEKQKAFYLKRFDPSKLEKLDDDALKTYLDAEAKEYAEHAKLFGVDDTAQATPGVKTTDTGGEDPVEAALKETIGG